MPDVILAWLLLALIAGVIIAAIRYSNSRYRAKLDFDAKIKNAGFRVTRRVGIFCVDDINKIWWLENTRKEPKYYKFDDIIDYEIVVDGDKIKTKGGFSRAVAGGLLFGGVGAIVGASTAKKQNTINTMYMVIILKDGSTERISFINSDTEIGSAYYNSAKTLCENVEAFIISIMHEVNNTLSS